MKNIFHSLRLMVITIGIVIGFLSLANPVQGISPQEKYSANKIELTNKLNGANYTNYPFPTPTPVKDLLSGFQGTISSVKTDKPTKAPPARMTFIEQSRQIDSDPIPEQWINYKDDYWNFSIDLPTDWVVHNDPYIGLGFNISSPDLELDPIGNPSRGAYISITVQMIENFNWTNYYQNVYKYSQIGLVSKPDLIPFESYLVRGVDEFQKEFLDLVSYDKGHVYRFHFLTSAKNDYFQFAQIIFSSIKLIGTPTSYPKSPEMMNSQTLNFNFTSLKLPFIFGPGKIISGYYHQNPPNQFALDLCDGQNCTQSTLGQAILAPGNIKFDWSMDADGNGSVDFHFFEIANDGTNKLCTQMGHFQLGWTNLAQGIEIPIGAQIGSIVAYSPSVPHIHMGLYTIPNNYRCAGDPTKRIGVPLVAPYSLDGVSYLVGESHKGKTVTSTNMPFCWNPYAQLNDPALVLQDSDLNADCFPDSSDKIPPSGNFTSPSNGATINSRSVTVAANASDNSGGSGVREVRFSAKWDGNWYGIGASSSAPYSINWDMCNSGVPDGDIELGMEIWDNSSNLFIWSEHGANPHITKGYTCIGGDPVQGGPWTTQAWQNKYLAGYSNWDGTFTWPDGYPYVWFDWGNGAPFGWGGDEFSMRLTRSVYFPGGYYEFHADHDDGVRVFIDGQKILDAWWDSHGGHDAGVNITQGNHEVKVEYYENQGEALVHVLWYGAGYPKPDTASPIGRITSPDHLSATNLPVLPISAEAWDDVSGVDRVEFNAWYCYSGVCEWRLLANDSSAPYSFDWDWSSIGDVHVWLDLKVFDKTGKYSWNQDGWVEVDLDQTRPNIQIQSPGSNQVLFGNQIPIIVSASDGGSGISGVQFFGGYDDGSGTYWREVGWDSTLENGYYQLNWDASSVPAGTMISFFVYAYDNAGNYQSSSVSNNILNGKVTFLPLISKP